MFVAETVQRTRVLQLVPGDPPSPDGYGAAGEDEGKDKGGDKVRDEVGESS